MTSRLPPQCLSCKHWVSPLDRADDSDSPTQTCTAFPAGIPDDIWWNRADHRESFDGDNGITWEAIEGMTFPDWALTEG